ncbi:hypothetical protein J2Z48_002808 [Croceifilum oryzae]|uniref:Uncharacterized protein n=1 Tax=Croceifilum oryzae TaxID=1553429 RepID=A0AAJ1TPM1_9BACL|nr:hypothetical protein [Croceifilum oryzae]MDQ0418605.1 hypothetical protein [Croceifilum oryzae]
MLKAKKIFMPVLIALVMFCLTLSPSLRVTAQTNDTGIVVVKGNEAKKWVNTMLHAVEKGEVKKVAPLSAFAFERSVVYTVGGGVTVVTVPLQGDYSLSSNVTTFFDKNDAVLQTNESLVTKNVFGNFQVNKYLNGVSTTSTDTGIAYKTDDQMRAEKPFGSGIKPMGVKKIAACLTVVMGLGGTLGYVIAASCVGTCMAPTPVTAAICAACIGAFAAVGVGTMSQAQACFSH